MPGQFGPIRRDLVWPSRRRFTFTMSCCGMPSVIVTIRPISASIASMMAAAANGGGTYITVASQFVPCFACRKTRQTCLRANRETKTGRIGNSYKITFRQFAANTSFTLLKTGRPRCFWPPLPGETPPTILVPYSMACWLWKVPWSRQQEIKLEAQYRKLLDIYGMFHIIQNQMCPISMRMYRFTLHTCFPVNPWQMTFVLLLTSMFGLDAS